MFCNNVNNLLRMHYCNEIYHPDVVPMVPVSVQRFSLCTRAMVVV